MGAGGKIDGLGIATVVERDGKGQVKLRYPWLDDDLVSDWVRIATPMAGGGRGVFMMPEVGDEVVVGFEHGRFDHALVLGFLWNGVDNTPASDPRERMIASKNGHRIRMLDATPAAGSQGAIVIEDAHGNRLTLSNGQITISAAVVLRLAAPTVLINGRLVQPIPTPI